MLYELSEIKNKRKKLGINQKELAERAGVSQSLIAKVEAGKIEPSYHKAKKIFGALSELEGKEEVKAKELMNRKVVFVREGEKVKEVVKVMGRKGISQMPVGGKGKVKGLISEKIILEKMAGGKEVGEMKAGEVMGDCPPIVSGETSQRVILEILKEQAIVLVAEKGEIKGIISKSDLLGKV